MRIKIHRHVPFETEKHPSADGGRITYQACICGALKPIDGWVWRRRTRIIVSVES